MKKQNGYNKKKEGLRKKRILLFFSGQYAQPRY